MVTVGGNGTGAEQEKLGLAVHSAADLEQLFTQQFYAGYRTVLRGGAREPLYQPAPESGVNVIFYRENFFASALHEVAHWCIAGERRRHLVDFGYWYLPDGRNAEQQQAFEQVEVKPQAIECLFSAAAGVKFQVSVDNLSMPSLAIDTFVDQVNHQAEEYRANGLPHRAEMFRAALCEFYGRTCL